MFDVLTIENAGSPFSSGANQFSCFEHLSNRFGIYVIENKADGSVLYVGQAWKQSLKTRICQNYTKRNTGGTFRINWCRAECKSFEDFKRLLSAARIKVVCVPKSAGVLICALESILISVLKPRYNNNA